MEWGSQQKAALDGVSAWHKNCLAEIDRGEPLSQPVYRVFGFAGSGKTTLAVHFANSIDGATCYAAFTGKAAMVMRKAGCEGASTIHSLMYEPKRNRETEIIEFKWNIDSDAARAALICIDEVSMVDEQLGADLLRYGVPILVLGDPAQLPPVKSRKDNENGTGAGFFTAQEPDVMLTEIHRQARENPIIQLATLIREGGELDVCDLGRAKVITRDQVNSKMILDADQVLVGRNLTREQYNNRIRELRGIQSVFPVKGEKLVCLRNDKSLGIHNGGMFEVVQQRPMNKTLGRKHRMQMVVKSLDHDNAFAFEVECAQECWKGGLNELHWKAKRGTQEFTFGYALTVHKSQGSQWDDVVIFDQSAAFRDDWRKWLYTGITRAAETLTIVI